MEKKYYEIQADVITVEIQDSRSGVVIRRVLPISFYENPWFLRLQGQSLDGSKGEIIYYSSGFPVMERNLPPPPSRP